MTRRIGLTSALAIVAGLALAAPAGADAATTLGETFEPTSGDCAPAGRTFFQTAPSNYVVASDGVITSWRFQTDASPPQIKLKVAHPQSADLFRIVGESPVETPAASSLNSYPTQIPVTSGDVLGFRLVTQGGCYRTAPSDSYHWTELLDATSDPPPGTDAAVNGDAVGIQFPIGATLEPDCDKDGLGDETQDADVSSCHSNAFTFGGVKLDKKKGTATLAVNVPESGDLSGSGNGAKVSSARAVTSKSVGAGQAQLLIKAKGKKRKKLNQKGKVKLNIAVTYTPTRGKPNTQSVKVKLTKKLKR